MNNPYSNEWKKIDTIAQNVKVLLEKIRELESQASRIQSQIAQVPYETDEEGNDVNAGKRNALYAQLESVYALIEEANNRKQQLSGEAYSLAQGYQAEAKVYEEKTKKTNEAKSGFNKLSGYRFGTRTAEAGAQVAGQREEYYQSYVNVLVELSSAAQSAASGISMTGNSQTIADRGAFINPSGIGSSGNVNRQSKAGIVNQNSQNELWNGTPGDSVKRTYDKEAVTVLEGLGVNGIPYRSGKPDFSQVSHATVSMNMDGVGSVAAADAMLAYNYGVSGNEIATYRQENGLEWRNSENGQNASLIPENVSKAYNEGREEPMEPSAPDALTAYMWAHNYGKDDYDIYSKDPEWQRLHREAFPEYYRKEVLEKDEVRRESIQGELQQNGIPYENFTGYTVAPNINDEYVVVGSAKNYQKYMDFRNNDGAYVFEECNSRIFVDSRQIEGVEISQHDLESPNGFWGMHSESFESWSQSLDTIPIIQQELKNGRSIEELQHDKKLAKCVSGFFDINHGDPINVYEVDGIYVLAGGGRHRTMIGQKMNINVPVRVVGKYKKINMEV